MSGTAYFHLDNVGVAAISGGVGSVISGGKFENGAVTGAFGYIFNEKQHDLSGKGPNERGDLGVDLAEDDFVKAGYKIL